MNNKNELNIRYNICQHNSTGVQVREREMAPYHWPMQYVIHTDAVCVNN